VTGSTKETASDTFGPPADPLGKGRGTAWRGPPVADVDPASGSFGGALAWVPEASLLIVGNAGFTIGGLDNAGQIYVYRVF
jgi:hypothetical protein